MKRWLLFALFALAASCAQAGCKVSSGGAALSFPAYKPLTFRSELSSPDVDGTATINIACNAVLAPVTCLLPLLATAYTVRIGAGASGNVLARAMPGSNGGPAMKYNLFTNSARNLPWGDGVTGNTVAGLVVGCGANNHTVYARIPGGQNTLKPGTFSESLAVTVVF